MTTKPDSFTSIDNDLLADVQGGCGKKRGRRCCGCNVTNVVNNYAAPQQAASTGTSVDVNVGYAGGQAASPSAGGSASVNYSYSA